MHSSIHSFVRCSSSLSKASASRTQRSRLSRPSHRLLHLHQLEHRPLDDHLHVSLVLGPHLRLDGPDQGLDAVAGLRGPGAASHGHHRGRFDGDHQRPLGRTDHYLSGLPRLLRRLQSRQEILVHHLHYGHHGGLSGAFVYLLPRHVLLPQETAGQCIQRHARCCLLTVCMYVHVQRRPNLTALYLKRKLFFELRLFDVKFPFRLSHFYLK